MPFDYHVAAEPQYFAGQHVVLTAVHDHDGVDSLADAFDDKPELGNTLQHIGSSRAAIRGAGDDCGRFRKKFLEATGYVNTKSS
ncbi:hypothetical protein JK2ML_0024 [Mycobacterium leprae Kyoto-2]|uniref:Uncharacterized protein n=3 Tax=Mycobacterium leprae TaxID=1769 RepID=Q9CDE2_MYCLE|nr:hypothetical protein DIJ64_00130 [Mycobacterium leprae]OAR19541.1 hypothetical protein A8144_04545 [Mycobacterium leprae 3125609]OAX71564.1 hypothetical protein A3216_05095 [Mycobacterium leprae 7935681]CAR70117.1 hypothetical protein MLBr00024 [Mycobacterium leprae Br4923]BBC16312.1 hypothetical protein JK2ML_0024 [Mycobacterium leprae Kyoto-2]